MKKQPQTQRESQKAPATNPTFASKTSGAPVSVVQPSSASRLTAPLSELARKIISYRRKEEAVDPAELKKLSEDLQQEAQKNLAEVPEKLLGILALCAIPGHDVHFLSQDLEIDRHIPESEVLEGRLQEARQILHQRKNHLLAIFVFERSFQFLQKNGEVTHD